MKAVLRDPTIADVQLVTVSIAFDAAPEAPTFNRELLGNSLGKGKRESVWQLLKYFFFSARAHQCGDVVIHFGEPISLKEHLMRLKTRFDNEGLEVNLAWQPKRHYYQELLPWHDPEKAVTPLVDAEKMMFRAVVYDMLYRKPFPISIWM